MSDVVPPRIARPRAEPATIHSVYRSVVNVSIGDDLLSIASPATGGLPNGVLVDLGPDLRALGLRSGMPVGTAEAGLGVPDIGLHIDLAGATRWSPRLRRPDGGTDQAATRWRCRSSSAWAIARDRSVTGGLGAILRDEVPGRDDLGFVPRARGVMDHIRGALLAGDRQAAGESTRGLIGLGPGLTPSGDDVLAGIEAGLHALDAATAGFLGDALTDVHDRTTVVAAALLRHAANGEFAERIHALLRSLLAADDEPLPVAIDRAVAWGATSGTDSLLGVLIGLDVACATRRWAA